MSTLYSRPWNWSPSGQMLSGQVRTDSADWTSPSELWVHRVAQDGVDVAAQMPLITVGSTLRLQMKGDSTRFALFSVTAVGTTDGAYWTFPVTLGQTAGAIPSANQACEIWVSTPDPDVTDLQPEVADLQATVAPLPQELADLTSRVATLEADIGVIPPESTARVCNQYDDNGFAVHQAPVRYVHDDPNTMPDIYWCQHCHQVFVTVDPQWSV